MLLANWRALPQAGCKIGRRALTETIADFNIPPERSPPRTNARAH